MVSELARLAAGIPVAALLPLALPGLRASRLAAAALAAILAAVVVAPLFPDWRAVLLMTVAAAVAGLAPRAGSETLDIRVPAIGISLVVLAGATAALIDAERTWDGVRDVVLDNEVSLVASGALAAVFIGGHVVGRVLAPFSNALRQYRDEDLRSLQNAGTYIGWFERALFFSFLVVGEPQAAAVALAAKSFARFPALNQRQEGFAEYFLVGSLASLAVAAAAAIATRGALGLSAF